MDAKETIKALLEASEDGTITAEQVTQAGLKLHELSQCCLQHLSVQLCRLNCKCNGLTCNFFLQNVPPFAALQVPL